MFSLGTFQILCVHVMQISFLLKDIWGVYFFSVSEHTVLTYLITDIIYLFNSFVVLLIVYKWIWYFYTVPSWQYSLFHMNKTHIETQLSA